MYALSEELKSFVGRNKPSGADIPLDDIATLCTTLGLVFVPADDLSEDAKNLRRRFEIQEGSTFAFDPGNGEFVTLGSRTHGNRIWFVLENIAEGDRFITFTPRLNSGSLAVRLANTLGFKQQIVPLPEAVATLPLPPAGWMNVQCSDTAYIEQTLMFESSARQLGMEFLLLIGGSLNLLRGN